ncbi:ABC transporter substrate-binding protein [Pseudonocardia sp. NPDC049154]|uniref:ABC transporter substrate-binding protein n=1 Tax=Pseudonocardia sp. NPDC049154 TaxID=3155501 RepID=UPI00340F7EE9
MRSRSGGRIPALIAALVSALLLASGCAGSGGQDTAAGDGPEKLEISYQGWANQVTFPELAADLGYLGDIKLNWVGNTISGPQDIQSAATGQVDFGGAFAGAVAKLITSGAPVTAVVNYYGSDDKTFGGYYVPADSPIRTARDLIGKKIGVNTLGGQAEAVINAYLKQGGLTPDEIAQVQLVVLPPLNTEESLRRGQLDVGALSGVLQDHALEVGGLRPLFTDSGLFGSFSGGQYVLRNDFIEENPRTTEILVSGIARAIEWARTTPREEVIARFTAIIDKRGRNESTANLKYWKSTGIPSTVIADTDFTRWSDWLQYTGVPDVDVPKLYTNEFNPYRPGGPAAAGSPEVAAR